MKALWDALIARMLYWLTPKPYVPPPAPVPEPPLRPGACECEHMRCVHVGGKGRCTVQYLPHSDDNNTDHLLVCACDVFIPDDDEDDEEPNPETPTPSELERIFAK